MKERSFNLIMFIISVLIACVMFWWLISTAMYVDENPPFTINESINTGIAKINNDIVLIDGGVENVRVILDDRIMEIKDNGIYYIDISCLKKIGNTND